MKQLSKKCALGGCQIPVSVIVLAVLTVLTLLFPYAKYKYNGSFYNVPGYYFLTGNTICGGTCTFGPHGIIWLIVLLAILLIVTSVLFGMDRFSTKKTGWGMSFCAMAMIFAIVFISSRFSRILSEAKNVSASYGTILAIVLCALMLVRVYVLLWKKKVMSPLDFMLLPGLAYLIINNYIPMAGIFIAFKKVDYSVGIFKSAWVGWDNFKILFSTNGNLWKSDAFIITRNTLCYNLAFIVLGMITGIVVGICLADLWSKAAQRFFQTAVLLPQLISMVIIAYIVYGFLSPGTGFLNNTLLADNPIDFYQERKFWPFILVFVQLWKNTGYNSIIFLSSIVGIDATLYEAARVDGATKWEQIRKITLPMLKPTVITLFLLQVGRIFYSDFGLFYQVPMDSGTLYAVTNTVDTYVYRSLLTLNNISTSSAASTYQAVVGFALVLIVNLIVRKVDRENAMF